jgi:hypothetical protein
LDTVQKTYEDFIEMGSNGTFKNSGQITLTHEINNTTMTLALEFLPKIRAAYKNVVDVATCMNITNPYHETTVTFPVFGASATTNTTASAVSGAASGAVAAASGAAAGSSPSTASSSAVVKGASTSAGVQINPNHLIMGAFAIAAYLF